ncbi:E3 ubiquitin-protein ligase MARCHF7 [Microcaecilia unicolor]|uniref:RING-type E3 ubiquitin transferase n=1 Tax=Microcaecilia unicolor TaxID=1415580 RepID=A0A6P7YB16_9AMPH|nr:E3 ubiquitin-protein ligase MARCH7 [Microcaecilia unicolor]
MQSKPSRIPRRISVQPSNTPPLSARELHGGGGGPTSSDVYYKRENSVRLQSNYQDSNVFETPGGSYFQERDASESSWKLTSPSSPRYSGTFDRPWSGSLGSRSKLSTASMPAQPAWYDESERTHGAYSRLLNQQQDWDSKRPKLSYSGFTSASGVSSNHHAVSDSSWRYGHAPRSSSVVLASSGSELMRDRRDPEKSTDSPVNSLVDYNHRNGDLTSSSYLQDSVTTSYSQGARPKENSLSNLRLNTSSVNHHVPSEHPSLFTRELHRSSSRSTMSTAREMDSTQRSTPLAFTHITNRGEAFPLNTSSSQQRSGNELPSDTEGRRTSRQILSRLASSMSSTFFSRRSSQDSLNVRTLESEDSYTVPRAQSSTSSVSALAADVMDNRTSEPSQGFGFLRRRRGGLSADSQNLATDSDAERYRQDGYRTPSTWLSSSFRSRCTPLFSRRRREGRDESARQSSVSDVSSTSPQRFRSDSRGGSLVEVQRRNSTTTAASTSPVPAESANSSGTAASTAISDSVHSRRNSGISGILPSSLFRFAVPHGNGSSGSDNVMITVDIVPSLRTLTDEQESDQDHKPSRDPEKIKKIQESLLLEDSEEEEGDLCRICQMGVASQTNPLIEPCRCTGSLQYVHQECIKKWLQAKINSGSTLDAVTTCELCKEKLKLNLEDFDIHELYRTRANERAEYEFISSGLYLVVLLHLCEQRFSDILGAASDASTRVRFINLARTLQAHMEDLETSEDDSEGDSDGSRTF